MAEKKKLICRYCSWSTNFWYTTKKGETRGPKTAWRRLREHVVYNHDGVLSPYEELSSPSTNDESLDSKKQSESSHFGACDTREEWEDLTW